ncbi:uncharacterized protein [Drosophila kikkawai]|uniref:Uncharacterized protein isoform X2 n=1 Tax=Drosophila kikkawai TaxID=30033 RepID=A0A6P4I5I1_DROKI|nr:uncharacterized protein LOC108075477 isoform X2 [Drosophila kikkawai]
MAPDKGIQIQAQTGQGCPDICPAVYMPVCGEAKIDGEAVKCEFGNGCMMGVSSCRHDINWGEVPLEKCLRPSNSCSRFL